MATSGTQTDDSFTEGLRKVLSNIQNLKLSNDADMPFTINLETLLLQRLKQQGSDAINNAQAAATGMPGGPTNGLNAAVAQTPGPAMLPPGMGAGVPGAGMPVAAPAGVGPALPAAAVPGLMQGPNMPNVDELRRLLSSGNTALRLNNVANRLAGLG